MSSKSTSKSAQTRDARLKAALKANMGRRKAQARARQAQQAQTQSGDQPAEKKE